MSADWWTRFTEIVRWLDPVGAIVLILVGARVAWQFSVALIRGTLRVHAGRVMEEARWDG